MRFLISFLLAIIIISCNHSDKKGMPSTTNTEAALKDSANYTTLQWIDSTNKNFGKISEGQQLEVSYVFKNTGNKPLIITRVQPSCGCTIAEQPTEPILPGATGVIKASFNSDHHVGINNKSLHVYANTKITQSHELKFEVEVEKKKW